MKCKDYFISFQYKFNGGYGVGYRSVTQTKFKPLTWQYIEKTLEEIRKNNGYDSIVLLNFGRYER